MRPVFLSVLLLLIMLFGNSCSLLNRPSRAQNLLAKQKFTKALALLHKELNKDSSSVPAHYLLSKLWLDSAWNQQIDSAHFYIKQAQVLAPATSDKMAKKWHIINLDSSLLYSQHASVDSAAFARGKAENSVASFQYFIDEYSLASQIPEAISLRNELAFAQASGINSWQAYLKFYQAYPLAEQALEAKELYEQLLFEERTQTGTLQAFRNFLAEQPNTPYRDRLLRNIYYLSTAANTKSAYRAYIKEFGLNQYSRQALTHLFYSANEPLTNWNGLPLPDSLRALLDTKGQLQLAVKDSASWRFISENGTNWPVSVADVHPDYLCQSTKQLWAEVWNGQQSEIIALNGTSIYNGPYEEVKELADGLLKIKRHGLWSLWLVNGQPLLPFRYQEIEAVEGGLFVCRQAGKWGLLAGNGHWLLPPQPYQISVHYPLIKLQNTKAEIAMNTVANLIRLTQQNQNWIPNFIFIDAEFTQDSIVSLQSIDSTWQIARKESLAPVLQPFSNKPKLIGNSICIVTEKDKYRILKLENNHQDSTLYSAVSVRNGWLFAKDTLGWQAISLNGHMRTASYDTIFAYHPNILRVVNASSDSLKFVVPGKLIKVPAKANVRILKPAAIADSSKASDPFLITLEAGGTTQLYADNATLLGEYKNAEISWPEFRVILVKTSKGTRLLSSSGELISKRKFEAAGNYNNGNLALLENKKFGTYKPAKGWLLPPKYIAIPKPYGDSLYIITEKGKWGLVDHQANTILKSQYLELSFWSDSICLIKKEARGFWQLINFRTQSIFIDSLQNPKFIGQAAAKSDYMQVEVAGYSGVLSKTKGWVVPASYSIIENRGSVAHPLFYCEREIENNLYEIAYYNHVGTKLFEQHYPEEDWLQVICE